RTNRAQLCAVAWWDTSAISTTTNASAVSARQGEQPPPRPPNDHHRDQDRHRRTDGDERGLFDVDADRMELAYIRRGLRTLDTCGGLAGLSVCGRTRNVGVRVSFDQSAPDEQHRGEREQAPGERPDPTAAADHHGGTTELIYE